MKGALPASQLSCGLQGAASAVSSAMCNTFLSFSWGPRMATGQCTTGALVLISCAALSACVSTSQVLEMGRDTYSVSATADGYRDAASARQSAFQAGAQKCGSLGKHFMFVNESTARTRMGIDTTVNVTFRCLAENDPEYARPNVRQSPDVVIEDQRQK